MSQSLASKVEEANAVLFSGGALNAVERFFAPDYVAHFTNQEMKGGHGAIHRVLAGIRESFPDLQVEVEILLEGVNRVAWQRTLRGTHQAAFKGFPGSGRRIVWRDMVVSHFRDGLIVEEWVVTDLAERLLLSRKN
ncbi:MAG TPA: ester cyclase [Pseudoxanthomonas sp.]|nr:ester cyclase [Pseudoxanthomonas sp.]